MQGFWRGRRDLSGSAWPAGLGCNSQLQAWGQTSFPVLELVVPGLHLSKIWISAVLARPQRGRELWIGAAAALSFIRGVSAESSGKIPPLEETATATPASSLHFCVVARRVCRE